MNRELFGDRMTEERPDPADSSAAAAPEDEAKRQAHSVASLVREAIDARFSLIGRDERLAAVEAISAMSGGSPFLTPEQINRAVEEEREAILPGG